MPLNFNNWAIDRAGGVVSSTWSLMLGPSSIIFTNAAIRDVQILSDNPVKD